MITASATDSVPPFTPLRLITEASFDPVLGTLLILAAGLYLWGVHRLRVRGHHWSTVRTVAWLGGGLGSIAVVTLGGAAAYEETLFSVHMVQHMVLSMVAPVFLALGAPVTLALRTLPGRGAARRGLLATLHSRVVRILTFPLIPFAIFVASPFALYFTGWYAATLDNPWVHEAMHLHFLLAGCLFFWPLVGLDPVPGRVSHPMRMLILVATLPLHAILGLTIMNQRMLIAADHYQALNLVWSDPVSEQRVGGGLLWASGDLVGLIMLGVAAYQWMRASEREAAREDRHLDRLEDAGGMSTPRYDPAP
ncbi:MAG: cytochrome c oxidase assembly protein [Geodermatophilaceae bacterium]|nr:cytochrome c oxidase assembly protein [Geodermatophilaceae bacterium]